MDKKNLFSNLNRIILLCFIVIICFAVMSCSSFRNDWIIEDPKYYTGEQIEEVFHSNEAMFTEVAKIVRERNAFVERIREEGDGDARVMWKTDSQYFNEEQWQKITDFFQEIKPLDIMRYQAVSFGYTEGIEINFPQNNEGKSVSLYYIDLRNLDNEIATARLQLGFYDVFKRIGEHWWLGARLDDDYSNDLNMDNSHYEDGEWRRKEEAQVQGPSRQDLSNDSSIFTIIQWIDICLRIFWSNVGI